MFFHDSGVSQIRSPHGHLRHYLLRHTDHRSDTITNQPEASIVTDSAICKVANVTQCHSSHQRGFKCHTFQSSEVPNVTNPTHLWDQLKDFIRFCHFGWLTSVGFKCHSPREASNVTLLAHFGYSFFLIYLCLHEVLSQEFCHTKTIRQVKPIPHTFVSTRML